MLEKKRGLQILKIRVRELFTHGEGISTLRARHKGRQPLIECAQHDFKINYFPRAVNCFCYIILLYIFFLFFPSRQGCCLCSYISPSTMRKSELRSSLCLNVCVLN